MLFLFDKYFDFFPYSSISLSFLYLFQNSSDGMRALLLAELKDIAKSMQSFPTNHEMSAQLKAKFDLKYKKVGVQF